MKLRIMSIVLLGAVLLGGFIASFFTASIRSALTLPAHPTLAHADMREVNGQHAPSHPVPTLTTPVQNQTNQMDTGLLAQDTFQRPNQNLWGNASDGRVWEGDANSSPAFSITNAMGQVANGQGGLNALLGPSSDNSEALVSGSVNHFNQAQVNLGVVLRWSDGNNWYKVLLDGVHFILLKRAGGATTQLGSVLFPAQDGVTYSILFRAVGATLFAKAWQSDTPEPARWMLIVNDMTLASGQSGIRVLVQNTTIITIRSFQVTAASSGV